MIFTRKKDKMEGKNKRERLQGGADCQSHYYQEELKILIILSNMYQNMFLHTNICLTRKKYNNIHYS